MNFAKEIIALEYNIYNNFFFLFISQKIFYKNFNILICLNYAKKGFLLNQKIQLYFKK